jgi:hypothetical protein
MSRVVFALLVWVLWSGVAAAQTTYYVRTDGSNSNAGTSNTAGGAWLTVDFCADNMVAGDTCRVQTGTYAAAVTPADSGTSGNVITLVADGTVTTCGWTFTNISYVRMIGFTVNGTVGGCSTSARGVLLAGTNTGIEVWNNNLISTGGIGLGTTERCNKCIILGNVVDQVRVGFGDGMGIIIRGDDSLIGYNEVDGADADAFAFHGDNQRWFNNYTHDLFENGGAHSDIFQFGSASQGLTNLVVEGTFQVGVGNVGDEHTSQISCAGSGAGSCGTVTNIIYRNNVWHDLSNATHGINAAIDGDIAYTRLYHNTTARAQMNTTSVEAAVVTLTAGVTNVHIYNEINYQAWSPDVTTAVEVYRHDNGAPAFTLGYNLAYDPDGSVTFHAEWTAQTGDQSNVNPNFSDFASDDFTLGAGSGDGANARGTGGPLTTTTGTGTSTIVTLAANGGGFFRGDNTDLDQYGGNLLTGDVITIGTDTCTIQSISGDSVTCAETITWADAESVYFGTDTTPDLGAYPYKAGGYSLTATYSNNAGTLTITPNDADLVRWVICYEDSIPTTVDNASPYTCDVGGGTVDVRVYKRYASKAPMWATATADSVIPANLVIPRRILRSPGDDDD